MIEDAKKINLVLKYSVEDIKAIIKKMSDVAREIYGPKILDEGNSKLMILITGGSGDFSIAINVIYK